MSNRFYRSRYCCRRISALYFLAVVAFAMMTFIGEAHAQEHSDSAPNSDSYEASNRQVGAFNDFLDRILLTPGARAYDFVTPDFMQTGARNFINNVGEPYTMFNNILQLKMVDTYKGLARFGINSVLGLFGLVDVASYMGLEVPAEDLGQTLGAWGVGAGNYLVIPFLGPSNERDIVPRLIEFSYSPDTAYLSLTSGQESLLTVVGILDGRKRLFALEESIIGDRYIFIRDAYLQNRRYQVFDGRLPTDDIWLYQQTDDELEQLDELDELE